MSRMKEHMMTHEQDTFQDKMEMYDLLKAALNSGFKYEYFRYLGTDEYLIRVFSDDGELTANVSKEELMALGMEV